MKKVELKVIEEHNVNGKNEPLDYKEQFVRIVSMPVGGLNLAEMVGVEKVYRKLDEAKCPGVVEFEDAEHETLKQALEGSKFGIYTPEIKAMLESAIAGEEVKG